MRVVSVVRQLPSQTNTEKRGQLIIYEIDSIVVLGWPPGIGVCLGVLN